MSEIELLLLDQTENCTVYTIQFLSDDADGSVIITESEIETDKTFEL